MPGMFHTFNIKNLKKLVFQIALPLLLGFISAFLSGDQKAVYDSLVLPPYAPPSWLFGVVWPVLYILMGISAYLVQKTDFYDAGKKRAFLFYYLQLAVNFFWSIFFFRFMMFGLSFWWLILLLVLVIATAVMFYDRSRVAGWLMLPYVAWLSYAAYLNYMVWMLN